MGGVESLALAMPALADQFGTAAERLPTFADELRCRLQTFVEQACEDADELAAIVDGVGVLVLAVGPLADAFGPAAEGVPTVANELHARLRAARDRFEAAATFGAHVEAPGDAPVEVRHGC